MDHTSLFGTMKQLVEGIEASLRSRATLEDLAAASHVSKFHLHRAFRRITGYSVMNYVRSRKLAASLQELLGSGLRIADIAQEYGFEHHQSYIRAFKREFGMTPQEFRGGQSPLSIVEKIDPGEWEEAGAGLIIKPQIMVKPAFRLVGVRQWVDEADNRLHQSANRAGQEFFFRERHRVPYPVNPDVYIGLTRVPEEYKGVTSYMPSLEVSRLEDIPEGMTADTVPAHKYAVFKYIGMHGPEQVSSATLSYLWQYVFRDWMPRFDRGKADRLSFERIDSGIADEHYCEVELYYPLERLASANHSIRLSF